MTGIGGEGIAAGPVPLVLPTYAGTLVRARSAWLRRLFIPGSLIAGTLGLLLGPEVAGRVTGTDGLWTESVLSVWGALPELLITVVFAALFLGKRIPGKRAIWNMAGPQVAFGQTMAWGQYVIGLLLALLVLGPVFGVPAVSGTLIGSAVSLSVSRYPVRSRAALISWHGGLDSDVNPSSSSAPAWRGRPAPIVAVTARAPAPAISSARVVTRGGLLWETVRSRSSARAAGRARSSIPSRRPTRKSPTASGAAPNTRYRRTSPTGTSRSRRQ